MNKQDAQNLLVFLQRVQLKGDEAVEFVRLSQLLANIMKTDYPVQDQTISSTADVQQTPETKDK